MKFYTAVQYNNNTWSLSIIIHDLCLSKVKPFKYQEVDNVFAERSARIFFIFHKGELAIVYHLVV